MSTKDAKVFGSITILSGLGATLFSSLLIWLFSQTVDIKPLTKAVDGNTKVLKEIKESDKKQEARLMQLIHNQSQVLAVERERIRHIEMTCQANSKNIEKCEEKHYGATFRKGMQ